MSRVIIANMSKSTLKIKTYLIIGKKKLVKTKKAQNWILFIIPSVSIRNKKNMAAGMSGAKSVNVEMGAEWTPFFSRISFWRVRMSLKMKNVMNWPMPGNNEPTAASFGKNRVSVNLRRFLKIW